jgi:uncharacterized protein YecT (DUF1311 family)
MRQINETEINAKLAELDKKFENVKAQVAESERQAVAGREEALRIQGEYRAWLSLKENETKTDLPASPEAASV